MCTCFTVKNRVNFYSKVLLPSCPCWQQLEDLDYGEHAAVLHTGVTYIVSVHYLHIINTTVSNLLVSDECQTINQ